VLIGARRRSESRPQAAPTLDLDRPVRPLITDHRRSTMGKYERGEERPLNLRARLLLAGVRGAVAGAIHTGLTWLIDQLSGAE
jgi:hypothetical protein